MTRYKQSLSNREFALFGMPEANQELLFSLLPERFHYDPKAYAIMKSSQT